MSSELEQVLRSVPVDQWEVRQNIVIDGRDGPREGWCALRRPACCFYYRLLAESFAGEQLIDRLFELGAAPADAVDQLLAALEPVGPPNGSTWAPVWLFPNPLDEARASQLVRSLLAQSQLATGLIQGRNFDQLTRYWTKAYQLD